MIMKTSKEMFDNLWAIRKDAIDAIIERMEAHDLTDLDMLVDKNGLHPDDDGFDEDSMYDEMVNIECYGKYSDENGYITHVALVDGQLRIEAIGEESRCRYTYGYTEDDAYVWASVLAWVEAYITD